MKYRSPPLFKSPSYTTSLLRKTYISTSFRKAKKNRRIFAFMKKANTASSVCFAAAVREAVHLSSESPTSPIKLLPGYHIQHQALNRACERQRLSSILCFQLLLYALHHFGLWTVSQEHSTFTQRGENLCITNRKNLDLVVGKKGMSYFILST